MADHILISINATCLLLVALAAIWTMQRDMGNHNLIARFIMAGIGATAIGAAGDNIASQSVPLMSAVVFHSFLGCLALLALSPGYRISAGP